MNNIYYNKTTQHPTGFYLLSPAEGRGLIEKDEDGHDRSAENKVLLVRETSCGIVTKQKLQKISFSVAKKKKELFMEKKNPWRII